MEARGNEEAKRLGDLGIRRIRSRGKGEWDSKGEASLIRGVRKGDGRHIQFISPFNEHVTAYLRRFE